MTFLEKMRAQLLLHEGIRLHPYKDTAGKLTIGVGRNLDDVGISRDEALYMLNNDIKYVIYALSMNLPFWNDIDEVRQRVLIDMCFNMGIGNFLTFKKMLGALERGDYKRASIALQKSRYCKQVRTRCARLVEMMRTGNDYC